MGFIGFLKRELKVILGLGGAGLAAIMAAGAFPQGHTLLGVGLLGVGLVLALWAVYHQKEADKGNY